MPPFPEAAPGRAGRHPAAAQPRPRDRRRSATKRAAVVAEVADWEELRLAGAAIKDDVLRDLDDATSTQLEAHADRAPAATVHWARDAAEANAIVAAVAQAHGADEVVKVKSMATQEIELNEALAAARASPPGRPTSPS